jgi:hypothetical protein
MSIKIPNYPDLWESGVDGAAPAVWFGSTVPDGDAKPFTLAAPGSLYIQKSTTPTVWTKTTDEGRDDDWSTSMGVVAQRITIAEFTDGGATTGTFTMTGQIPVGAFVTRVVVSNVTGFAGDTTAVLMVGDGTDDDRYNASGDMDVFTTVAALDGGIPQGEAVHIAAKTPVLTITSSTNFTLLITDGHGAMTVKIFYVR